MMSTIDINYGYRYLKKITKHKLIDGRRSSLKILTLCVMIPFFLYCLTLKAGQLRSMSEFESIQDQDIPQEISNKQDRKVGIYEEEIVRSCNRLPSCPVVPPNLREYIFHFRLKRKDNKILR